MAAAAGGLGGDDGAVVHSAIRINQFPFGPRPPSTRSRVAGRHVWWCSSLPCRDTRLPTMHHPRPLLLVSSQPPLLNNSTVDSSSTSPFLRSLLPRLRLPSSPSAGSNTPSRHHPAQTYFTSSALGQNCQAPTTVTLDPSGPSIVSLLKPGVLQSLPMLLLCCLGFST